ncbi:mammalian cell entry protein [Mycolicibacter sinensis]|uniref:Mammalian cell entry protein n=2 Tax=Mycolicibacter sinensis (strain JDM601) TaxID=875328 RepID=A0A1A3U147_MYCSD|nr:mammalian cell entry protein [Mycolicibacter sinensis]
MRLKTGLAIGSFVLFMVMILGFVQYVRSLGITVRPPEHRTNLSMEVSDINNIVVDANVLLRGVPVGKVTGVDTTTANAIVHFYVDDAHRIPIDSTVRLDNLSALGESYIELEPRSTGGPVMRDGQRIAPHDVKQPPSISELGTSVVRVLNELDPDQLSRVIDEADAGLPDPHVVLPNLSHASLVLRNTTADFHGTGQRLLGNMQTLLRNAGFVGPALAATAPPLKDIGPAISITWNDVWTAGLFLLPTDTLTFSALLTRLQRFLDDRGGDLKILGVATSGNMKLIANALRNFDSTQVMKNLQATVPADGPIDIHVAVPAG